MRVEDGEDSLLLDESADRLDGLRGVLGVVADPVVDPALVHAAARVHELEVRLCAAGDRGVRAAGRSAATYRDDDGGRADAGSRRPGERGRKDDCECRTDRTDENETTPDHLDRE